MFSLRHLLDRAEDFTPWHQQQAQPQQPQVPANSGLPVRPFYNGPSPQTGDPKDQGYAPDITYNPNPNIDIPYSAHTPQLAQMGNQYTANPQSSQFTGIDPGLFGYPADGQGGVNPNDALRGDFTRNAFDNILKRFRF